MTRRTLGPKESGLALVVALFITLIVFLITTVILADAFHNVVGSGQSWKRLAAINAAEAGVDAFSNFLESGSTSQDHLTSASFGWTGSGNTWTRTGGTIGGIPSSASFTQKAEYYLDGALSVPFSNISSYQATSVGFPTQMWVRLTTEGAAPSGCTSSTSGCVRRGMQSVFELRTVRGSLKGAFAGMFMCELGNRFSITGSFADLYFIGTDPVGIAPECASGDALNVTSGQLSTTGSVYVVRGSASLSRSVKIDGNLWAKKALTISSGGGAGGTCSWTASTQVLICGNATSGLSISVSPPTSVLGTASVCANCAPATPDFPKIKWNPDYPGTALTYAAGILKTSNASSRTYYITSCAAKTDLDTGTLRMSGDVTIVSNCGFNFSKRVEVRADAGTRPRLSLISVFPASGGPACSAPTSQHDSTDPRDITISQNFDASAITLFLYTPCTVILKNQVNINGAIVGGQLQVTGRTTINTVDLSLTGNKPGPVNGFQQRILWKREIAV